MRRQIHSDEAGLWISAGGWVIRPTFPTTLGIKGKFVEITSVDPVSRNFGVVSFPTGHKERWKIRNSETTETRPHGWTPGHP